MTQSIHHGNAEQLLNCSFRINDVMEDIKLFNLELGDKTIPATLLCCEREQFAESGSFLDKY